MEPRLVWRHPFSNVCAEVSLSEIQELKQSFPAEYGIQWSAVQWTQKDDIIVVRPRPLTFILLFRSGREPENKVFGHEKWYTVADLKKTVFDILRHGNFELMINGAPPSHESQMLVTFRQEDGNEVPVMVCDREERSNVKVVCDNGSEVIAINPYDTFRNLRSEIAASRLFQGMDCEKIKLKQDGILLNSEQLDDRLCDRNVREILALFQETSSIPCLILDSQEVIQVEVNDTFCVEELRHAIAEKLNVEPEDILLAYQGHVLDSDVFLEQEQIAPGTVVSVDVDYSEAVLLETMIGK